MLRGVSRFGARNSQDPLAGFPATDVDTLTRMELGHLFRQATVLEAMLVALNHMQVSVCMFEGGRIVAPASRASGKNIISFPQHVSELQQHLSFVANVAEHDIVNVLCAADASDLLNRGSRAFDVPACSRKGLMLFLSSSLTKLHQVWSPPRTFVHGSSCPGARATSSIP